MNTDKNTVIGFVLMGILLMGYLWYTSSTQQVYLKEQRRIEDSIAKVKAANIRPLDTLAAKADSLIRDSIQNRTAAGNFREVLNGSEKLTVIDNRLMRVTFTNKGGQLKSVQLKKYRSYDSSQVIMAGSDFDKISYNLNTSPGQASSSSNFFFVPSAVTLNADSSQTVVFTLPSADGNSVSHEYIVKKDDYLIDWNILLKGADRLLTNNEINLNWQVLAARLQSDVQYERQQAKLCYLQDDSYNAENAVDGTTERFEKPVKWLSLKQQFFNSAIIAKGNFASGEVGITLPADSLYIVSKATANMKVRLPVSGTGTVPFQLYYGPNEFHVLRKYDLQMESIIDLGSGVFAFVKYINRYIIMPVFDFFAKFIHNYGWVIALLTIFIRLVTSPLTYTSYLSGAKMKVLRPELDVLKKKFGEDQQGFAVQQMKLFREAGVNPLGGCIPALLQIPIFFALYSFFNSEISLRGQHFLWAKDLSSYDVIATLPFSVPLGFGDHISLFTITAVITSFLISIYNMNMTPDQNNPVLKYMPYIFPFVLLFIFNRLPSALTWYYTVSNLITLILQYVIQNYIINHDRILVKMDEARKKPKTKSKWQEKYEQMLESQKKVQELKHRTEKK